jgi:hypothetical protein
LAHLSPSSHTSPWHHSAQRHLVPTTEVPTSQTLHACRSNLPSPVKDSSSLTSSIAYFPTGHVCTMRWWYPYTLSTYFLHLGINQMV